MEQNTKFTALHPLKSPLHFSSLIHDTCSKINLFFTNILTKKFYEAYLNIKQGKLDQGKWNKTTVQIRSQDFPVEYCNIYLISVMLQSIYSN